MRFLHWFLNPILAIAINIHIQQQSLRLETNPVETSPLFALHRALIEIPSVSGHEHDVANYLESYLIAHNFTVEKQTVEPLRILTDHPLTAAPPTEQPHDTTSSLTPANRGKAASS